MPLIKMLVTVPVPEARRAALVKSASEILCGATGKPEKYAMAMLEQGIAACMAGKPAAAAFVDVRSIGSLNKDVNAKISRQICDLLQKELKIDPLNVFLNFTDVPAQNWGWSGATFG